MLSVIVPTYNRAAMVPVALASLLAQKPSVGLDIIVVDDGSEDETPSVLADLAARHPEIRVIRQDNAGVTAARNTGLAALLPETSFVSFLDSDDVSPMGRFDADLPLLLADPSLALTYGKAVMTNAIDPVTFALAEGAVRLEIRGIHLASAILRRSLVDRIGFFDTELRQAEDTDYLLRIFETGLPWKQTDTVCLYYLRHAGNMTRNVDEVKRCFTAALARSLRRRRADPSIVLKMPNFEAHELIEAGFF